jgi:hypothetical protein
VLYEDLRIELHGMKATNVPELDILDSQQDLPDRPEMVGLYRYHYFFRRSLATLRDFEEGLRLLNENKSFAAVRKGFDGPSRQAWDDGIAFFDLVKRRLKDVRNDIGGHFGLPAARESVMRLPGDSIGKLELVVKSGEVKDIKLYFAGEMACTALLKHLPDCDISNYRDFFEVMILPGFRHAKECVGVLCAAWLWPRFGG